MTEKLPHWDLSEIYPGLDTPEFAEGFANGLQTIKALVALFDQHHINRIDDATQMPEDATAVLEQIVTAYNSGVDEIITLYTYIFSFIATDSRNTAAQAKLSEIQQQFSHLSLLGTRLTAWLGSLDVEALINDSTIAADHAFVLRRAQQEAEHLMSPIEEALAAELNLTGSQSWNRLFNTYTSQLTVTVEMEGESKEMPLTAAQNLMFSPDRDLRKQANDQIEAALAKAAVPNAAALNAIKGETLALSRRRGWESPLDMVLFDNAIDRETLEAMNDAARRAFPDFQRYLRARARFLELPILAHYDRLVPLGQGSQQWSYGEVQQFIIEQFRTYSPRMADLAQRAFANGWIDAEPRDGKRGGAFCMWLRNGDSRILSNFEPSFNSLGTLAHELGHAYHNLNLRDRTILQRSLPMTLAETASTFCQKVVENAALKTAVKSDQIIILDTLLEYAARVVLGATSDFDFETEVFKLRAQRDLSVEELCDLSFKTRMAPVGDTIDPETHTRYRWVYVPHYYGSSYYNFPYTFGLLFGLGLYARYQENADEFRQGYDDLLSATGMGEAADLAARFGINIRDTAFWEGSLDVLRADIDRFDKLVP
ncbi:MAG: M3 family oligoendopeptidase [Ardenticatenaceae bacterium]|nr:M3 family oligoendopeptidase [Ardenticatenaceae bacterium]